MRSVSPSGSHAGKIGLSPLCVVGLLITQRQYGPVFLPPLHPNPTNSFPSTESLKDKTSLMNSGSQRVIDPTSKSNHVAG